ncbi:MAG: 1,4-alpha-glucan branching protein domain-containing protein [Chromatiaceae bacterium]
MTPPAQLALVLHAHLPYVRHPEQVSSLEENWLHEAIADCYLPLLGVLEAARARGSRCCLTLSLSPTLLSMLAAPGLPDRFLDYLDRRLRLCAGELTRQRDPRQLRLTLWYQRQFEARRHQFLEGLGADLIGAWTRLRDDHRVELITTAATHGYPPLLRTHPGAIRAQLRVGRDTFIALTGQAPAGLWLPECGYFPGLETEIAAAGYGYSLLDAHGLQQGLPRPPWGVYAPVVAGGVAFFGRDPDSAREVWGREAGYPAHPDYREYYSDLGLAGPSKALAEFLPPGVAAGPTGIKYLRVTGGVGPKGLYDPASAARRAAQDARSFVAQRRQLIARLPAVARPPVIVAPFDAELFGHWWYEGPLFLDALIRELEVSEDLVMVSLGQHLADHGVAGPCRVAASSWGEGGYNGTWLRPETAWVHLQLQQAAVEFQTLRHNHGAAPATSPRGRLLRQAARSLLLAQGSDWTFHLGRGGGGPYAEARLRAHLARFAFLADALRRGLDPGDRLVGLELLDGLFPDLDPGHFG